MSWGKIIIAFCSLSLLFFGALPSAEQELLKASDINKVMQQIFAQHVDKKSITAPILKNAFRIYIDQFDPTRSYLLEEEVAPYLQMSNEEMTRVMEQYRQQNFTAFAQLNSLIQKAIERARTYRHELEKEKNNLFQATPTNWDPSSTGYEDPDLKVTFAKTDEELKERIKERIVHFIYGEKVHFGDGSVMRNQDRTLELYERHLVNHEDSYLFKDDQGRPITYANQENLFVIHVLKALAGSLDAHTTFYNNSEAYDLKVRLEKAFEGIGVVLQRSADGAVIITRLVKGGPAAKSNLVMEQDHILSINGKSIADQPFEKVMDLIRGERGSSIQLLLQRKVNEKQQLVEVQLKREPITVDEDRVDVTSEAFANGIIGTITLHSFYQGANGITSENDMLAALKELSKKGTLKGVILDMRENSGGFLTQAIKVAGLFIKSGIIVISKYSNGNVQYYRDMGGHASYTGPLVVLVSKATASAAEIVAQALQDYGVALIVGDEHTYGKGTIQSQTVTDNQATSYFKVTVGKYYTVSGRTPQMRGVESDIVVPGPYDFEHIGEQFLEYALPNDTIKPEYKDDLKDVDPGLRSWYLRYYLPALQPKVITWQRLLPTLKQESNERIARNKEYQAMIAEWKLDENSSGTNNGVEQNQTKEDFQLLEATNILKDMIILRARERQAVASPITQPFSGPLDQ